MRATVRLAPRNLANRGSEIHGYQNESRLRCNLATKLIAELTAKVTIYLPDRSIASAPDVVLAMASVVSERNPWTTRDTSVIASTHLDVTCQDGVFAIIETLLKEKIRPLFTKTRNPAVTSEGRKNFHPIPLSRFDGSVFDDSTKPWKSSDIYATSALAWIISQYKVRLPNRSP